MHNVLVDEEFILFVKRQSGLGDDDGVVFDGCADLAIGVLAALDEGVHLTGDLASGHVVVLLQGLGDVIDIGF